VTVFVGEREECPRASYCEAEHPPMGGAGRWYAVSALIINVDNTILNVALPTLVRDLHATSSALQWIVDSYAMVFAGLLLVGGSLALIGSAANASSSSD
jgi:MFS family permease